VLIQSFDIHLRRRISQKLSDFSSVGVVPVGEAVAVFGDDEAEPFEAFEVFGDGVEFLLGGASCELGGDLFGGPVAGGGAEQVADGGEMGFGLGRPLLLDRAKLITGLREQSKFIFRINIYYLIFLIF
jgi:hypothetical protein